MPCRGCHLLGNAKCEKGSVVLAKENPLSFTLVLHYDAFKSSRGLYSRLVGNHNSDG